MSAFYFSTNQDLICLVLLEQTVVQDFDHFT